MRQQLFSMWAQNSLGQRNRTQLFIYVVQPLIIRDESYTECVARMRQIVAYANVSSYHCSVVAGHNCYTCLFLSTHRTMTLPAPYIVPTKLSVCLHVLIINQSFVFIIHIQNLLYCTEITLVLMYCCILIFHFQLFFHYVSI